MPAFAPLPQPAHVLLVEDETLIRMMAADVLEEAGFTVTEAATADAAWSILNLRPDDIGVLFTDVDMPGSMDGVTLVERVAASWPHIRLVVTSGRHPLADRDLPDNGRFLGKPYHPSELMGAIDRAA
ncbi:MULTISPECIES: response regulator [Methylobacterium]|uniref:response regulator n=1 Tax=Methylobacterium TaxID=407 RepID=UPI00104ABB2A|nr:MULTISPECIES: response regulator [Methylobacterium]MDR7036501.1 CheY-like chemotaxis protein [Methylobacterium sp. BE186]